MKTNLQKVYTQHEPKKIEFAIDEPYKKPKLRAPYFKPELVENRRAYKLQQRFNELKKGYKPKEISLKDRLKLFWTKVAGRMN